MYLGIYLSTSFISVNFLGMDTIDYDGSVNQKTGFSIPLLAHIDKEYVYLGEEVTDLLAFRPDIPVGQHFFDKLSEWEEIVYTDASGFQWNKLALFCLFLRRIAEHSRKQANETIQGVFITTSLAVNSDSYTYINTAFQTINMPFEGVIPFEDLFSIVYKNQKISTQILFIQNSNSVQTRLFSVDENNMTVDSSSFFAKGLGTENFYDALSKMLVNKYMSLVGSKIGITDTVRAYFLENTKKIINEYSTSKRQFFKILVGVREPILEFMVLRSEIDELLNSFIKAIANSLLEHIQKGKKGVEDFSTIYLAGVAPLSLLVNRTLATHPSLPTHKIVSDHLLVDIVTQGMQIIFKDKPLLKQYQKNYEYNLTKDAQFSADTKRGEDHQNTIFLSDSLIQKIKSVRINFGVMK